MTYSSNDSENGDADGELAFSSGGAIMDALAEKDPSLKTSPKPKVEKKKTSAAELKKIQDQIK